MPQRFPVRRAVSGPSRTGLRERLAQRGANPLLRWGRMKRRLQPSPNPIRIETLLARRVSRTGPCRCSRHRIRYGLKLFQLCASTSGVAGCSRHRIRYGLKPLSRLDHFGGGHALQPSPNPIRIETRRHGPRGPAGPRGLQPSPNPIRIETRQVLAPTLVSHFCCSRHRIRYGLKHPSENTSAIVRCPRCSRHRIRYGLKLVCAAMKMRSGESCSRHRIRYGLKRAHRRCGDPRSERLQPSPNPIRIETVAPGWSSALQTVAAVTESDTD